MDARRPDGIEGGIWGNTMAQTTRITIEVPEEPLRKAREASGAGITQTVRAVLDLAAASRAYAQLLQLRAKVHFSRTLADLKDDR